MSHPLVTLIIPVYNVAPYLEQCLASVRAQTHHALEVLLINDGSTDGSEAVCRSFTKRDKRFRLVNKENGGVSSSRNLALGMARGKYIQFLDGDDYLSPDATETFVHEAESTGADLVISHFYRVDGERQAEQGHIKARKVLTRKEFAEAMMKAPANFYYGVLWNKFYRRAVIEAEKLRFDTGVDWCEDFLFNLNYLEYVRLVAALPQPLYYYRKRSDSAVNSQIDLRKTVETKRMTFSYYKELYQKLDLYEEQKARVYSYLVSAATDGHVGLLSEKVEDESRT